MAVVQNSIGAIVMSSSKCGIQQSQHDVPLGLSKLLFARQSDLSSMAKTYGVSDRKKTLG